jgi:acyl-CoA reductase-like NAD-dependent aldehyde dehydrogenase
VRYRNGRIVKKRKLRRIIQSIDFGKKKYRFSSDERIKGVSLTGSEAAGSMAEAAGKYLKNQYLN